MKSGTRDEDDGVRCERGGGHKWWCFGVDDGSAELAVAVVGFWRWVFEVAGHGGGVAEAEWWREREKIRSSFNHIPDLI